MLWRETDETMHQTILTFQRFEHCQYDLVSQSTGLLLVVILTMSSSSNSVMSAAEILKGAKNLFSDFGYIHSFYYVLVSSWHAMRILCFFGASCKQKKLCLNWQNVDQFCWSHNSILTITHMISQNDDDYSYSESPFCELMDILQFRSL